MASTLSITDLSVCYGGVRALDSISFNVQTGQIVGIVGESGCGKSTILKAIMGLLGVGAEIISGSISLDGQELVGLDGRAYRDLRGKRLAMIFQHADTSLCPTRKIKHQLHDMAISHGLSDMGQAERDLADIFERLSLKDGSKLLDAYPFELSGGMSQRVSIAMAMLLAPSFLLADEPTSALDVTVQAQVVNEMMQLRDEFGTGIVIVTHNMGVVAHMVDQVGVVYAGNLVEFGPKEDVLSRPLHPYTKALLDAIPRLGGEVPKALPGLPPQLGSISEGCCFAGRCPHADETCLVGSVDLCGDDAHWARCGKGGVS